MGMKVARTWITSSVKGSGLVGKASCQLRVQTTAREVRGDLGCGRFAVEALVFHPVENAFLELPGGCLA